MMFVCGYIINYEDIRILLSISVKLGEMLKFFYYKI